MKRFLVPFLPVLCMLLLSGYSHWHTYASGNSILRSSIILSEKAEHTDFGADQKGLVLMTLPWSAGEKQVLEVCTAEIAEEEDAGHEELSLKKKSRGNCFAAFLCSLTPSGFFNYIKAKLSFDKELPYIPSSRQHLIIRVLRI